MKRYLLISALLLTGCASFPSGTTTTPLGPAVTDLRELTAQATQAYLDYKSGNVNWAWAVSNGLRAYQTSVRTYADIKKVVADFSAGSAKGQTFAQRLAELFAASPVKAEVKAQILAETIESVAGDKGP